MESFVGGTAETEILRILSEVREVFESHFDKTWVGQLLEEIPLDSHALREIRHVISLRRIYPGEESDVWQGVLDLEHFTSQVKLFLLPMLRERLGICGLSPERRFVSKTDLIIRKFIAFAFPYNLERLSVLTARLRECLLLHYPEVAKESMTTHVLSYAVAR